MSLTDLDHRDRRDYSQNGEDGVIQAIFEEIGVTNGSVEISATGRC